MTKILVDKAVIEQALDALNSSRPIDEQDDDYLERLWSANLAARRALRAALEQPKPLPSTVWRFVPTTMTDAMVAVDKELRHAVPWIRWEAILAAAPQPHRQPLTDDEINTIWRNSTHMTIVEVVRAIEAAHGIKEQK